MWSLVARMLDSVVFSLMLVASSTLYAVQVHVLIASFATSLVAHERPVRTDKTVSLSVRLMILLRTKYVNKLESVGSLNVNVAML